MPQKRGQRRDSTSLYAGSSSDASTFQDSFADNREDEIFDQPNSNTFLHKAQFIVIGVCWLIFTYFLMVHPETHYENVSITVPAGKDGFKYTITNHQLESSLCLRLYGAFIKNTFVYNEVLSNYYHSPHMAVMLQSLYPDGSVKKNKSLFYLQLSENMHIEMVEKIIENLSLVKGNYQLHFVSNINETLPLQMGYKFTFVSKKSGLIFGIILLILIYMALMLELVHRTIAGMVCSTLAIGIIASVHLRPSLDVIFAEWANIDTTMCFFGISLILELLSETGLHDRLAAYIYELANGHVWPMLHYLLLATALLGNLFDEILLVLFIAPICLRLCEIMQLNCTPVLSALIIVINVSSTWTPITSLTNNFIANSRFLPKGRIKFIEFASHMLPPTLLALAQTYVHLRLKFYNSDKMRYYEPFPVRRLKRLIRVWRIASLTMGDYTWDDTLARKTMDRRVVSLRKRLKRLGRMPRRPTGFEQEVQNLHENFPLKKISILIICLLALFITPFLSVMARFYDSFDISKGLIAIFAALFSLSLTAYQDIDRLLSRIDWSTMLFFVSLTIIMQVLIVLGLLENIGLMLQYFIISLDENNRLTVAILLIIWISAILTTFIDKMPVAGMMMRIIGTLALNENIDMPIMPLVWSTVLGCSFGGTGSIVGTVANIACAGVVYRHGYNLRFISYFKIGFFIMIGNVIVASCYLLLVHVYFKWH